MNEVVPVTAVPQGGNETQGRADRPAAFSLEDKSVFVAGDRGMVGSALLRRLGREPCTILTARREELDLCRQDDVLRWMERAGPDVVVIAAAKVGGILANSTQPVDFLHTNLMIAANITEAAYRTGVEKLLFLGSSCIYPKMAEQPMREEALLTGYLEPTNEWYAIAKIAGIKLCQAYRRQYGCDFISAMPTNLYGPNDNFDPQTSHVLPALIRKIETARMEGHDHVTLWGTGTPRREFLHVDDLADALVFLLRNYSEDSHINVGCGEDITISELATKIARLAGWNGELRFDTGKPDGTPRKLLDVSRLNTMGWHPKIELETGIASVIDWYRSHVAGRADAARAPGTWAHAR